MTYTLDWEERPLGLLSGYLDDPNGLKLLLDALEELRSEPRPRGAARVGSDDRLRIRVGRYRVLIDVDDVAGTVLVVHIGRVAKDPS